MSFAISVHNVSKRYRLGEISRGQLLADLHRWWMRRVVRKTRNTKLQTDAESEEEGDFWALRDISLEIEQGETIAIIGANGAGKSTLLKIVSRITAPTTGVVRIKGRIGSLLEVGTGFHPELTGRDNVFLNGAILGMNRHEVRSKFDDIVNFSGLEQFIDTPVKRYSSGMYVRLAFSVAAFLEPEILIVDEVLSVGDQQFQDRCMERIEEIVDDGRTFLFVSHGADLIRRVCQRAVFLHHGKMIVDGEVDDALEAYADSAKHEAENRCQQTTTEHVPSNNPSSGDAAPNVAPPSADSASTDSLSKQTTSSKEWPDLSTAPGDDVVKLRAIRIVDSEGCPVESLLTTQTGTVEIEFVVLQGGKYLQPGMIFTDALGNTLFWTIDTNPILRRRAMESGRYKSSMVIPADFLAPGTIFIDIGLGQIFQHRVVSFSVIDDFSEDSVRGGYQGPLPGLVRPRMKWITTSIEDRTSS